MTLKPIGDRILIKPDANPETTESGLWISEDRKPELTGTVVAVGFCTHPLKAEADELARELEVRCGLHIAPSEADWIQQLPDVRAAKLLRAATARDPLVQVGDYVVFSWTAGQEVTMDEQRYLMMRETDIMAVIEGVEV